MNPVSAAFEPLMGTPSWHTVRGWGRFFTMEFGQPSLTIDHPRRLPIGIEGAPKDAIRRPVHVRGEWHLWIYHSQWLLTLEGSHLARSESDNQTIDRALAVLNGQQLINVQVAPIDGRSRFEFDLGCVLDTWPIPAEDELDVQWMLYQPADEVLTVRRDGKYCLASAKAKDEDKVWLPLSS